jgi:hypothetical protein
MTKKEIQKLSRLLKTHSQPTALLEMLSDGYEFTANEAKSAGVADPRRVVNRLRQHGFPIYLNRRSTRSGETVKRYRLGTPRQHGTKATV